MENILKCSASVKRRCHNGDTEIGYGVSRLLHALHARDCEQLPLERFVLVHVYHHLLALSVNAPLHQRRHHVLHIIPLLARDDVIPQNLQCSGVATVLACEREEMPVHETGKSNA